MEKYGSGEISLTETIAVMLAHDWVTPCRYKPSAETLPAVVEGSWVVIEESLFIGTITFFQYRSLSNTYDNLSGRRVPPATWPTATPGLFSA